MFRLKLKEVNIACPISHKYIIKQSWTQVNFVPEYAVFPIYDNGKSHISNMYSYIGILLDANFENNFKK